MNPNAAERKVLYLLKHAINICIPYVPQERYSYLILYLQNALMDRSDA